MTTLHIHRTHALGLARAREIAWAWAEQVEAQFGMECTVLEGESSDTVEFTRSGVNGELLVAADRFELTAQLGFLLGAFAKNIQGEIERNLDALLDADSNAGAQKARNSPADAAAAKATRKTAAKAEPTADKSAAKKRKA
jgi:putative polyhydroxyalkanoate system protein